MPRDLGDVLHYFLPEAEPGVTDATDRAPDVDVTRLATARPPVDPGPEARPAALPLLAIPIGDHDVVRAAFAWNLAVELARLGTRVRLVAPREAAGAPTLWPEFGGANGERGPLGTEIVRVDADDLASLYSAALDVAVDGAAGGHCERVLVRVPPPWLRSERRVPALLRQCLLFTSSDAEDLFESYGTAKLVHAQNGEAEIGVTVHGVRRVAEAREAFDKLADNVWKHLGRPVTSYGLLVDDLHIYRAIVAQRPIGLAHPQSPAARALRDVAEMVREDAAPAQETHASDEVLHG